MLAILLTMLLSTELNALEIEPKHVGCEYDVFFVERRAGFQTKTAALDYCAQRIEYWGGDTTDFFDSCEVWAVTDAGSPGSKIEFLLLIEFKDRGLRGEDFFDLSQNFATIYRRNLVQDRQPKTLLDFIGVCEITSNNNTPPDNDTGIYYNCEYLGGKRYKCDSDK